MVRAPPRDYDYSPTAVTYQKLAEGSFIILIIRFGVNLKKQQYTGGTTGGARLYNKYVLLFPVSSDGNVELSEVQTRKKVVDNLDQEM